MIRYLFLLLSITAYAQEERKVPEAEAVDPALVMVELAPADPAELKFSPEELQKAIKASAEHLKEIYGEEAMKNYEPVGVDVDIAKTTLLPDDKTLKSALKQLDAGTVNYCAADVKANSQLIDLSSNMTDIVQNLEGETSKNNGGMLYIIWGYHRGKHTKSDATFKTPDGTFTIHDAVGVDRQSSGFLTYIDPTKISQPQYNLRIGYAFNEKWAVEVGNDHMKWVFVPSSSGHKITGDYRDVWIDGSKVDFDVAKAQGNTNWLAFEHTDGYNYVNAGAVYTMNLLKSKNERFRLDAAAGAGMGVLLPKTRVQIGDTDDGHWRDVDNKFKIAGWGAHVDSRLKFVYKTKGGHEYFLMGSVRGSVGKINNAYFLGSDDGSLSQTPIYSAQFIAAAGYAIPIEKITGKKKKKK